MISYSTQIINKLTEFCKDYFNECLHEKKGYNLIYSIEDNSTKFEKYLSTRHEIIALVDPALSKKESIERIVYAIDCRKFNEYTGSDIKEMAYCMAFMLFGVMNGVQLMGHFNMTDDTQEFIQKVKI